jgi:hypothetical protein
VFAALCVLSCSGTAVAELQSDIRRPGEAGQRTRVEISVYVLDIDAIDTVNQAFQAHVFVEVRWQDTRLAHTASGPVTKTLGEVWHPDLMFANDQKVWQTLADVVQIQPDGDVIYAQHVWGTFAQPLELQDFPFDRQRFHIRVVSASHPPHQLEIVHGERAGVARQLAVPDWILTSWKAEPRPYQRVEGVPSVAGFAFVLEMSRNPKHFLVKIIIPLILIVAMSWSVFWIDPEETGTNVSVSVTAMLTLIAYRFSIGETFPALSYLTRMDYFILVSTLLVFTALVQMVIATWYVKSGRSQRARTLDRWCRWVYPVVYFYVVLESLFFTMWL